MKTQGDLAELERILGIRNGGDRKSSETEFPSATQKEYDRSILALKLKPVIAEKAKENMLATQNNDNASAYQKSEKQVNTTKEVAKLAGVSHDTI